MEHLSLGVGRRNITPPVGISLAGYGPGLYSDSVADDLAVTAFWFTQGSKKALMVNLTLCNLGTFIRNMMQDAIEANFPISRGNCMLSCTHTHSGPNVLTAQSEDDWRDCDPEYIKGILIPRMLEAIAEAQEAVRPVKMGVATGESFIGINRRQITEDNKVILGQCPWGSFDPTMTILSFRDFEGNTYANIVHYGLHGTCAGHNTAISRDWSGIMIDRLELHTGGITAFFNGTAGDTGPRLTNGHTNARSGNKYEYVREIGNMAALDAVRIWRTIRSYRNVPLQVADCTVSIPLNPRISVEKAEEGLTSVHELGPSVVNLGRRYYENVINSYNENYEEAATHDISEVLIRIGDVAFYGIPYEVFSGIGLRVRAYSHVPHPLCIGYTNGAEGYFATQDQLALGGYEVGSFRFRRIQQYVDNADWHLITSTVENLKLLADEDDA